jgi:glycosyltransferase involved in cell wall biosynthesis
MVAAAERPMTGCDQRREGGKRLRGRRDGPRAPLITIVIVAFNCAGELEATIQSVISQSSKDVECLIVDGGSNDGTLDIIQRYDQAVDYWLSERDHGIYDAFNKGVQLANGEWMLFLGSGDTLFDCDCIARAAAGLRTANGEAQIAYGRVARSGFDGSFVEEENEPWESIRDRWRGGRRVMPQHQGIFERRKFLAENIFDINYQIVADYKSFSHAIALHPPLYMDCVIARVSLGGVSSFPRKSFAASLEIIRLNRELGMGLDHLPHQMFFVVKSAVKTLLSVVLPLRSATRIIDAYREATGRRKMWT